MALANYAPNDWNDVAQVPTDYFYNTNAGSSPRILFMRTDHGYVAHSLGVLHYVS